MYVIVQLLTFEIYRNKMIFFRPKITNDATYQQYLKVYFTIEIQLFLKFLLIS